MQTIRVTVGRPFGDPHHYCDYILADVHGDEAVLIRRDRPGDTIGGMLHEAERVRAERLATKTTEGTT